MNYVEIKASSYYFFTLLYIVNTKIIDSKGYKI